MISYLFSTDHKLDETIHTIPRSISGKNIAKECKAGRVPSIVFEQEDGHHGGNKRLISIQTNQIKKLVNHLGRSFFLSRLFDLEVRPEFEVFSRSSREEDDEEALKWTSLEKLPTFDRLKKGLLLGSMGAPAMEVEIENLGPQEWRKLMERLVKVAEEDNEKFLLKLRDRIDRVGIDLPTIEVRYQHLSVDAEAHVGGRSLPTF